MSDFRVGSGFDAHRLVAGRALVLGGVVVNHDRGLEGHSDGDCLIHALCDALLGAVAAGDLGGHFPSSDPSLKDAASVAFLDRVVGVVAERGYAIGNVDVTLIAEAPALSPYVDAMRQTLSGCLGIGIGDVSVKAKSSDGMGSIGRGEGIAAMAVALVRRIEA